MRQFFCRARHRVIPWLVFVLVIGAVGHSRAMAAHDSEDIVVKSLVEDFDRVWEELVDTLNGKGLVVSSTSMIKRMLVNTGEAFGDPKKLFVDAKVLGFCSATLAREMFELDRHNVIFCPYKIAVYSLPSEADRVFLSFQRISHGKAKTAKDHVLRKVDLLLEELVTETINSIKSFQ